MDAKLSAQDTDLLTPTSYKTVIQEDQGSKQPAAISKLGQFCSPHFACVFFRRDR